MSEALSAARMRLAAVVNWVARTPQRAFVFLFLLSLVIRIALIPRVPHDPARQTEQEVGALADNLVRTGEYANPYALPTGPTGHTIPFYTVVMALIFQLFGVTIEAEYARCWLTIVSFSTMYGIMPWLDR